MGVKQTANLANPSMKCLFAGMLTCQCVLCYVFFVEVQGEGRRGGRVVTGGLSGEESHVQCCNLQYGED